MADKREATGRSGGRLDFLDGLRGVAALLVLVNHVYQQVFWTIRPQGIFAQVAPWLQLGHSSVVLFIVLSGFCLMRPVVLNGGVLRGGVRGFYAGRARRILPAYWAAVVCTLVLLLTPVGRPQGAMFDLSLMPTAAGIWAHLLLANNLLPAPYYGDCGNTQVCSVFWSVAVEWQIYALFPALVYFWRRWGSGMTVGLVGVMALGLWRLTQGNLSAGVNWQGVNADFYAFFALGMLAASVACAPHKAARGTCASWVMAAGLLGAGFALLYDRENRGLWPLTYQEVDVYSAVFFMVILIAASQPGRLQKALSWRPLVRVGTISFSVYLLHLPLVALLTDMILPHVRTGLSPLAAFLLLLALSIPLVLSVAALFARVFEDKDRISAGLERLHWFGKALAKSAYPYPTVPKGDF